MQVTETRDSGCVDSCFAGLPRWARKLPGDIPPRCAGRSGDRSGLDAGQFIRLREECGSRPALSDCAASGQADPGGAWRGVRCRCGHSPFIANLWPACCDENEVGRWAGALDSGGVCARICRSGAGDGFSLQSRSALCSGSGADDLLERSGAGNRVACFPPPMRSFPPKCKGSHSIQRKYSPKRDSPVGSTTKQDISWETGKRTRTNWRAASNL